MEHRTVTVIYRTRKVPHKNGYTISASGTCPECKQDYSSTVRQFKSWMRTHLRTSHMCKPRWRSRRG